MNLQGIWAALPGQHRVVSLASAGVTFGVYLLYSVLLFWTAPTVQGPGYDGPNRFPHLIAPVLGALVLVLALPVLLVRRRPLAMYAVILAETGLAAEFGARTWSFYAAAIVVIGYLAMMRSVAVSVCAAVAMLVTWLAEQAILGTVDDVAGSTGQLALYAACAWAVGYGLRRRREYSLALREQREASAVTSERLRIARELHDTVAHSIGIIAVLAGAGQRVFESQPAAAREALGTIEATSRETLIGMQRMVGALRHADLDDDSAPLRAATGLADLDHLVSRAAHTGLRVEVRRRGEQRTLPPEIDLSAFRLIQEAITNVVRHAGTHECRICIAYGEKDVAIEILDDGLGSAVRPHSGDSFGLVGMRERVAVLGGEFAAGPRPEGGFRVGARLPA
ncbi:sensor histidine kinase [Kribbella sp. NPDC059898]|uniref:sensor histidine kinase n=1 Tax=Kribbella sp. NPDC059898 TaxID=3346995 RepID=UPI003655AE4E